MEPAGRDPGRAFGVPRSGTSDALFRAKVQSFPDNFYARLGVGEQRQGLNADPGTISVGPCHEKGGFAARRLTPSNALVREEVQPDLGHSTRCVPISTRLR